jgi:hypothetical protein
MRKKMVAHSTLIVKHLPSCTLLTNLITTFGSIIDPENWLFRPFGERVKDGKKAGWEFIRYWPTQRL